MLKQDIVETSHRNLRNKISTQKNTITLFYTVKFVKIQDIKKEVTTDLNNICFCLKCLLE